MHRTVEEEEVRGKVWGEKGERGRRRKEKDVGDEERRIEEDLLKATRSQPLAEENHSSYFSLLSFLSFHSFQLPLARSLYRPAFLLLPVSRHSTPPPSSFVPFLRSLFLEPLNVNFPPRPFVEFLFPFVRSVRVKKKKRRNKNHSS